MKHPDRIYTAKSHQGQFRVLKTHEYQFKHVDIPSSCVKHTGHRSGFDFEVGQDALDRKERFLSCFYTIITNFVVVIVPKIALHNYYYWVVEKVLTILLTR